MNWKSRLLVGVLTALAMMLLTYALPRGGAVREAALVQFPMTAGVWAIFVLLFVKRFVELREGESAQALQCRDRLFRFFVECCDPVAHDVAARRDKTKILLEARHCLQTVVIQGKQLAEAFIAAADALFGSARRLHGPFF